MHTRHTLSEGIAQARREMAVRERRDITQGEVATGIGVTVAAYSRWETGQRVPREEDVAKLAEFFGVTPAYLRYGVVIPPSAPDDITALIDPTKDRRLTGAEIERAREAVAQEQRAAKPAKRKNGGRRV
jgi:transcriptional regulator with XRE-family HTH domain